MEEYSFIKRLIYKVELGNAYEEGYKEGQETGRKESVCNLLQQRFGKKLPAKLRQRIMEASRGQLDALGALLFEAASLQEFNQRSEKI
jgi:flagellar biosynthesis/type III secretory pathway protein FliH